MLWKNLLGPAQHTTLLSLRLHLHPLMWPKGMLNCAHRFTVPTNLCTVWKDPVRADIQLQLITCNSGQFEAIFLQCLPLLGIDYGPHANALSDEIHRFGKWGMGVLGQRKVASRRWKTDIIGQWVFIDCVQVLPHTTPCKYTHRS